MQRASYRAMLRARSPSSASRKGDYAGDYLQTVQKDWVSDLYNLWYPLRNVMIQIFKTPSADGPVADAQAALAQFRVALDAYVAHGMDLDITDYLQAEATDENGQLKPDCLMSAADNPEKKEVTPQQQFRRRSEPYRPSSPGLAAATARYDQAMVRLNQEEEEQVNMGLDDLATSLTIYNAQRGL